MNDKHIPAGMEKKAERIFQKSKYSELISKAQKEAFDNRQVIFL